MLHKTTTTHFRLELSARELIDLVNGSLPTSLLPTPVSIPRSAEVTVHVPGGGDWSNTDLTIDNDLPVVITWEMKEA